MSEVFGTSYAYICRFPHSTIYSSRCGGLGSLGDSVFFKTHGRWEAPGELGPPVSQTILLLVLSRGVPHSTAYYLLGLHLSESLDDFKIQNFQIVVHSHFSISTSNIATKPGRMWMILMISTSKPPHQTAQATIESAAFRAFHRVTLDDERCSGGNKWGNKTTVEETGMYIV